MFQRGVEGKDDVVVVVGSISNQNKTLNWYKTLFVASSVCDLKQKRKDFEAKFDSFDYKINLPW